LSILLTLAILGTWAILALGLVSMGVLFLERLGGVEASWQHAYFAAWIGFALLIAGLIVWHFFLPVNTIALLAFSGLAALAAIMERRWFAALLRRPLKWRFAAICAAFAIWVANQSLAASFGYDDYLYEFQATRWYHDYPIVPGLANLHGRIGFNNSHHLFAAMLSVGIWKGEVNHIFNGLFVVLACILLLAAVRDLTRGTKESLERSLLPALLFCPCAGLVLFGFDGSMLPTLKADVFLAAGTAVLVCLFLRWAATRSANGDSAALAATTLLVGAVLPTVKISAIVFSSFIVAVVAVVELRRIKGKGRDRRLVFGALAIALALAICFPIRGVILSGYPIYPAKVLGVNVDWKVSPAQADAERAYIKSCTYFQPTYDPREVSGWRWLPAWAATIARFDRINVLLPTFLTLICLPLLFARPPGKLRTEANAGSPGWAYATLVCASIANLVVWFTQAPAGRFVIVQLWILFAVTLLSGIRRQREGWSWKAPLIGLAFTLPLALLVLVQWLHIPGELRARVFAVLAFAALWLFLFGRLRAGHPRLLAALCILPALFQFAEHAGGEIADKRYGDLPSMLWVNASRLPRPKQPDASLRATRSGLNIYVAYHSTYDTPLPNTRYFNPFLELRTGRMKDGFRNSAPAYSSYGSETHPWFGYELNPNE
jgi:hypothetical protein